MSSPTTRGGGWITTVAPDDAEGELAEAYARQQAKIGYVTELTQLGSLYPRVVATRLELYDVVDSTPSNVPEWIRRAVALTTSALNGCLFCTAGHVRRLTDEGYGDVAEAIRRAPDSARTGDAAADAVLAYTRTLVTAPASVTAADVEALRAAGLDDLAILDVNNIAAYYCYINRVAAGLGLQGEG